MLHPIIAGSNLWPRCRQTKNWKSCRSALISHKENTILKYSLGSCWCGILVRDGPKADITIKGGCFYYFTLLLNCTSEAASTTPLCPHIVQHRSSWKNWCETNNLTQIQWSLYESVCNHFFLSPPAQSISVNRLVTGDSGQSQSEHTLGRLTLILDRISVGEIVTHWTIVQVLNATQSLSGCSKWDPLRENTLSDRWQAWLGNVCMYMSEPDSSLHVA